MTYAEAKEIIKYCEDRAMDFFHCHYSEADYKESKGYLEGSDQWKAIAERLAEKFKELANECCIDLDANYVIRNSRCQLVARKALADYEKLKGEK